MTTIFKNTQTELSFVNPLLRRLLIFCINLLLLSCVFDPADKLLGLKVPLFCVCWLICIIGYSEIFLKRGFHKGLLVYVTLMVLIPLVSIIIYFLTNGSQPYEGLTLFKSYLFISFSLILYVARIDLLQGLCRILNILAILILVVYFLVMLLPDLLTPVILFGDRYGVILIGDREYSSELTMRFVFFVTSPMLAISIAYYVNKAIVTLSWNKTGYILLSLLNIAAMFLAGTRNNMLVAICLPLTLIFLQSRRKIVIASFLLIFVIFFVITFMDELKILLSSDEESNQSKLGFMNDYFKIFQNPIDLLLGQGLGAYHYWTGRGPFFITELTYLEIIRTFGLFMGSVMFVLMLFPGIYAWFLNRSFPQKSIIVAYFFYLFMCMTNPLFFSSLGILILSIIISNIFGYSTDSKFQLPFMQKLTINHSNRKL